MINVAECKMIISMLEKQILDYQAKCEHKNYRGAPVEGGMIKCICADCQKIWYLED